MEKIENGWLTRLSLTTWTLNFQIFRFTLNMKVPMRWLLVMNLVGLSLMLAHYTLYCLITHFTYVILFVSLPYKKISYLFTISSNTIMCTLNSPLSFFSEASDQGMTLYTSDCEDGVYPFLEQLPMESKKVVAYVHEHTITDGWQRCLVHPSSKIFNHLIHSFSLQTNKMTTGLFVLPIHKLKSIINNLTLMVSLVVLHWN